MNMLPIEQLGSMPAAEEKRFWTTFESAVAADDGQAAKGHLAAGRPIYYWDDRLQGNIRKWPDGRCELVELDPAGQLAVVRVV